MPTLYVGHAQTGEPMVTWTVNTDYLTYFKNEFRPYRMAPATGEMFEVKHRDGNVEQVSDKDYRKRYYLWGAIGGRRNPNTKHNDTDTLGRDLMPLDFDDIPDEAAFLDKIHRTIDDRFGFGYVLYKTYSYRPDNVRYRLLVPLDREITVPANFKAIMEALAQTLGTELDTASTRWGQIFFLPTITKDNEENFMTVHDGPALPVDKLLDRILKAPEFAEQKKQLLEKPKVKYQAPKFKTRLGFALDKIASGKASTADYGWMESRLWRCNLSSAEIYPWLQYFNSLQPRQLHLRPQPQKHNRGEKTAWGKMFVAIINGTDEHDQSAGTARNGTMFNFVSFLLDQQVKIDTVVRFAEDLNDRNTPPLTSTELQGILSSALRRKVGD